MCKICYTPRLPFDQSPMPAFGTGFRSKYWEKGSVLKVSIDHASTSEVDYIMSAAQEWSEYADITFTYIRSWADADIRIGLDPREGSYSYLGTDASLLPKSWKTMNLGWLHELIQTNTKGTIIHEFGHALGLVHEHKRLEFITEKVYEEFMGPPNHWTKEMIDQNILNPLNLELMDLSESIDYDSVMMYFFPPGLTKDGKGTHTNEHISTGDAAFISRIYPKEEVKPIFTEDNVDKFIRQLIYAKSKTRLLDFRQLRLVCDELEVPYRLLDRSSELRDKLTKKLQL